MQTPRHYQCYYVADVGADDGKAPLVGLVAYIGEDDNYS